MERLTIERIVGDIALEIFFSTVVGITESDRISLNRTEPASEYVTNVV